MKSDRHISRFNRAAPVLAVALALASPSFALGPTETSQGIAGDIDLKDRSPILSFGKEVFRDSSRILADAVVRDKAYAKYPIRFDFYINGTLVQSQMRSPELPASAGVVLSKSLYPIPYNYTIVATLITPNRTFTTTAYGAVDGSNNAVSLSCALVLTNPDDDSATSFGADAVSVSTGGGDALTIEFTGTASEGSETKTVSAALNLTGSTASGTLAEGDAAPANVSGTVAYTDGNLTGVSVASADGTVSLECGE